MSQMNLFILLVGLVVFSILITGAFWLLFFRQPKPNQKVEGITEEEALTLLRFWCMSNQTSFMDPFWKQQLANGGWLFEMELLPESNTLRFEVTSNHEVILLN